MQDERTDLGWAQIPTCLQCSHQVYARPAESLEEIADTLRRLNYSEGNSKRRVAA